MKLNEQKPEKTLSAELDTLEVHSVFATIQGEGPFSGRAAVFVRLAGCNLQCPGCDTEYTKGRQVMHFSELMLRIKREKDITGNCTDLIVVTGGEPFRQPAVVKFINEWREQGWQVQVETNGVLEIPAELDRNVTIVCSPKTAKLHPRNHDRINAFKYVIDHRSVNDIDGLPLQALKHRASPCVARPERAVPVYVQPMDCGDKVWERSRNIDACVKATEKYGYTLQLQIHKLIGVE